MSPTLVYHPIKVSSGGPGETAASPRPDHPGLGRREAVPPKPSGLEDRARATLLIGGMEGVARE